MNAAIVAHPAAADPWMEIDRYVQDWRIRRAHIDGLPMTFREVLTMAQNRGAILTAKQETDENEVGTTAASAWRSVLKIAYAPMMLIGFIGSAIAVVTLDLPRVWLFPLVLTAIAISFLVERLIPYDPSWNRDRGDSRRDIVYAFFYEASVYVSIALIPLLTLLSPATGLWPHGLSLWGQLLLAIIIADFGITLCHYASHRFEWLWRFHAPHHSVKRMYGFNGLIKHPVHQALETAAGTAPLVLLGMSTDIGLLLGFAITVQLLLQHSNADMRIGPLRYVLALAPLHRFHHQKWAGIGDVNFGLFTNLWDHVLGTAVYDGSKRFTSDDLGIGLQPDYPVSYVGQLAAPFRTQSTQYGAPNAEPT